MTLAVFPERPRVAVPCGCILGETPIWDARVGALMWVDIRGHRVFRWVPGNGTEPDQIDLPEPVAFVQITEDPSVVLVGLKSGLASLDLTSGRHETLLRPEPDQPENRFNDSSVAPDGSLFLGTMDDSETRPTGAFYRWSPSGLVRFGELAVVTNGPTIDAERRLLYAADTQSRRVYRHLLGADWTPGPRQDFVAFGEGDGHPDGITVDAEGHVWICHFGGSRVTRFSPDGEAVLEVPIPTSQVTKIAFAGPDLSTIYVTTAARGLDREIDPLAGHLFVFEAGIRGLPAPICKMGKARA